MEGQYLHKIIDRNAKDILEYQKTGGSLWIPLF